MATFVSKVQIPFREKGQTTCIHHQNRKLELYCETCRELACTKCQSTLHKSHTMCSLSEITPQTKEAIRNFVDNTEKVDLVQIDQYIASTDAQLKENVSHFEKLSTELWTQTNKLKQDLDTLTSQTLSLYQKMKEDNTNLLQTYKQDLEKYSTQLKQQVQECKEALQLGFDISIYDTGCEIQSSATLPVKPTLGTIATASFTPNKNPESHLEQALGKVYTSCQGQDQALQVHDLTVGSSAGQGSSLTEQNSNGNEEDTLLSQTELLGKWRSPYFITSVCPINDGQVWTSNKTRDTLILLDRKGRVIQEVKHNTWITDISQSPTTNTLWVCDDKKSIKKVVSGQLVDRFSTSASPQCICITASNNVIVGMGNNISKYTTKGKLVRTTSATGGRKPLVCDPYRITECPVTHNVAVADWDSKLRFYNGEDKPRVVVMDTDFKKLFVYGGEVPSTFQPTSQSGGEPLYAHGLVYDSVGSLVIGDYDNQRILLISGRGEFLRIIHTDNNWTTAVGIDREDVLWAVFWNRSVKQLQYREREEQCIML